MHAVATMDELEAIMSPGGTFEGAEQVAVRNGKARFVQYHCMANQMFCSKRIFCIIIFL